MTIDALTSLIGGITPQNLFPFLAAYFNQREVQERMVELNQKQLYEEQIDHNGNYTPDYEAYTIDKREVYGYSLVPRKAYHYHETGDLFRAMGVQVGEDFVAIVCSSNNPYALDIDTGTTNESPAYTGYAKPSHGEEGHIEAMFDFYDTERDGLGLTEENFSEFMEGMKEAIVVGIKNVISGEDIPF